MQFFGGSSEDAAGRLVREHLHDPTSRWVGPIMGATIPLYGLVDGVVTLVRNAAA